MPSVSRRRLILWSGLGIVGVAGVARFFSTQAASSQGGDEMYGLIGKITTVAGKRDELAEILLTGTTSMPGCLSYVVAADSTDPNGLWISEVWETKANHSTSLSLPAVRDAIARGKPLIAGFSDRIETVPLGGHGLKR